MFIALLAFSFLIYNCFLIRLHDLHLKSSKGVNYNNPFGAILGPVVETVASKLRRPDDGSRDLHADYLDSVWSEFFDAVVAGKDLKPSSSPPKRMLSYKSSAAVSAARIRLA